MSNSFNRLHAILQKPQRYITKIDVVNSNGTTVIINSDGGKETVLGDSVSSGFAYVENGIILRAAATLSYTEIEI